MKKLLFLLSITLGVAGLAQAQMDEKTLKKSTKKAMRAYASYTTNNSNVDKLVEAQSILDEIMASKEGKNYPLALIAQGNVLNEMAGKDITKKLIDPNTEIEKPDAPLKAIEYFKKAYESGDEKMMKEAEKGMKTSHNYLAQIGNEKLGSNQYVEAFKYMNGILQISDVLDGANFDKPEAKFDQQYLVAFCALQADKGDLAFELAKELDASGYDEARIYAIGFDGALKAGKEAEANEFLAKGADKYPDNQEIMYAQINGLIKDGKFEELETLLGKAISKDPENASVRSALGNVLMNLSNQFYDTDKAKSDDYFERSKMNFEKAAELDPSMVDAVYSVGSLYYNRAVATQKEMNDLPLNAVKEMKEKEKLFNQYFDDALPYFQKAEQLQPNDRNTLIALKEIYARKSNFDMSKIFKERLETIEAGGEVSESYFKNN